MQARVARAVIALHDRWCRPGFVSAAYWCFVVLAILQTLLAW